MEKPEYEIMFSAENTYWWYCGLHELVALFLKQFSASLSRPPLILDAGCGTGRMLEIAREYGSTEGFDFSEEALHFCRRRGLTGVSRRDLSVWEPPHETYDCIISLDVLCHRDAGGENRAFSKFHAALKPGGLLMLNLPAFEILRRNHDAAVHTVKRFTKKETMSSLSSAGFAIVKATYRLPHFFFVMLAKKAMERIFPSAEIRSDLGVLPQWLNRLLLFLHRVENFIIFFWMPLPLGSSLFIAARKKTV